MKHCAQVASGTDRLISYCHQPPAVAGRVIYDMADL
jgi:hypothetical protein